MLVFRLALGFRVALAQEPPPAESPAEPLPAPAEPVPAEPAPAEPAISPEELAAIEAALGADTPPATTPAPTPTPGAVGRAIQSMNPDLSVVLDVGATAFSADAPLQTGAHDPTSDGFFLQQLEVSLSSVVDPYFRFDANLAFALDGVEVEEAYATTLALPGRIQIRAGQFLTRFGRLNPTHPHAWSFVDQPFAIGRAFGGEGNRGVGVEASILLPLPWSVELLASTNNVGEEGTHRTWAAAADDPIASPADLHTTAAIKQFFALSDDWSLSWGLSAATAPNGTDPDNRSDVWGTDVYLRYRPITVGSWSWVALESEWLYRRQRVPGERWTDTTSYTQLGWKFSRRWGVAGRWEYGTPTRNDDGDVVTDALDPDWTADRQRTSASLTYWPSHFSRLRLQGAADLLGWQDDPDLSAFLQFEVLAGAHGAHNY